RTRFAPAGEDARAVGAVRAAPRDRQPWPVCLRQYPRKLALRIPPDARVRNAGNNRGSLVWSRECRALFLPLRTTFGRGSFSLDLLLGGGVGLRLRRGPLKWRAGQEQPAKHARREGGQHTPR